MLLYRNGPLGLGLEWLHSRTAWSRQGTGGEVRRSGNQVMLTTQLYF